MRRLLISLLVASAAASPALAQSNDFRPHFGGGRQDARGEARSERPASREMRSDHSQAPQQVQVERAPQAVETHGASNDHPIQVRSFGGGGGDHPGMGMDRSANMDSANRMGGWRVRQVDSDTPSTMRSEHVQADQGTRRAPTNWRMHERQVRDAPSGHDGVASDTVEQAMPANGGRSIQWRRLPPGGSGDLVQPDRPLPRVMRARTPVVSDTPREGTQPPPRTELSHRTTVAHWDTSWRHNSRYNWWDWRRRHHHFFHLGFYYDPFGWSYQRYLVGWRLWPAYFGSNYWITDPWQYRLPYAPPGYRWIRYYDDLLLVDTWDGRVVDVIYDFFW
ncbi:MAG TPA: RcnB family protein [Sphingomicrobium sp.]